MLRASVACGAILVMAFAGLAESNAVGAGATTLSASAPVTIAGPPDSSAHQLTALDCPGTSLCVAGDAAGNLVVSAAASSGASAWTVAAQVDPGSQITAIACASLTRCVAAGSDGVIAHTTRPTGGAGGWRLTTRVVPAGDSLTSLSCPTARLCVGVDRQGDVVASRNPFGSANAWRVARVLAIRGDTLVSIDCPTASECVAIDRLGREVVHSTHPAGGPTTWHRTALHALGGAAGGPPALACASQSLCVIVGTDRNGIGPLIGTSTHPSGGRSAWRFGRPPKSLDDLTSVSCPAVRFCAVGNGDSATRIADSTRPAGGAATYRAGLRVPTDSGYPAVGGLSCPTTARCVLYSTAGASDIGTGEVAVSDRPTATSAQRWPAFVIDAYNPIDSVACPSATECLAGGPQKTVYTTADPTAGAGAWSATAVPVSVDRVACGAVDQCVVGGGASGDLAASATPSSGGWTTAQTSGDLPDGGGISILACTAGPFCVAGPYEVQSDSDFEGTSALVSSNPTGGTGAWEYREGAIEGGINGGRAPAKGTVTALACASPSLCVAGDAKGGILTATAPATDTAWAYARVDGTATVSDLTCPSTSLCVGVDSQGRILHSTDPAGAMWTSTSIDPGVALTAVSCASTTFCVAVDGHRHAFVSTLPTGGATAWRRIDGVDGDLTSIACPTTALCVAVDSQGSEITLDRGDGHG